MGLRIDYREISRPLNNGKGFSENPESTGVFFAQWFGTLWPRHLWMLQKKG
jgi:hypothetical protein